MVFLGYSAQTFTRRGFLVVSARTLTDSGPVCSMGFMAGRHACRFDPSSYARIKSRLCFSRDKT